MRISLGRRKSVSKNTNLLLFEITYFFLFAYAFFGHISPLTDILKTLSDVSLVLMVLLFFCHTKLEMRTILLKMIPLLLLSSIFIFTSNSFIPFKTMLLIIASFGVDFDERIKFDLKMRFVFTALLIFLSQTGIISNDAYLFKDGSDIVKYSLGFSSPNTLGMDVFIMCLEMVYLVGDKKKGLLVLIASAVFMISINIFTSSRTAIIAYIIFVLLVLLYRCRKKFFDKKLVRKMIVFSPLIITIVVTVFYFFLLNNPSIKQVVDQYTSGRFTNARIFIDRFPISLFGNDISILNQTCDISVVYILYSFGIIGASVYLIGFTKLLKFLYEKKEILLAIVFVGLFVYGIGEKLWLYPDYNIFMTIFSSIFIVEARTKKGIKENA